MKANSSQLFIPVIQYLKYLICPHTGEIHIKNVSPAISNITGSAHEDDEVPKVYICICLCVYICMYIHTYEHKHTHMYTHTHVFFNQKCFLVSKKVNFKYITFFFLLPHPECTYRTMCFSSLFTAPFPGNYPKQVIHKHMFNGTISRKLGALQDPAHTADMKCWAPKKSIQSESTTESYTFKGVWFKEISPLNKESLALWHS